MPTKPRSRCTGCKALHHGTGKCDDCRRNQQARSDARRGTSTARGYGARHRTTFRTEVLANDPFCVCAETGHGHGTPCGQPSTQADHHPRSRRWLEAAGLDPDDPAYGRGLCTPCHSAETATHQPGGWNNRGATTT